MTNIDSTIYNVIGLMSGTSLDGVDVAFCRFTVDNNKWSYDLIHAETVPYSPEVKSRLLSMESADAITFLQTHTDYGLFLGMLVSDFIIRHTIKADFVSSHGHTIFHQPEKKLTVQIGMGSAIAARCKLPVVCDFRSLDVALGGQGAPLVPVGDKLLFSEYDFCLNLGGFANISYEHKGERIAYDICPVNIVMNPICEQLGKPFDDKGEIARSGMLSNYLLNEFNQIGFYKALADSPKSLGKEWVIKNIDPLLNTYELSENDLLRTFCEHIAFQVGKALKNKSKGKILITGGGAY
ncbi:MAG: anhydro-N-acetylmuramic acid kinase, partial [Bacteroidia bacterium]